MRLTTVMRLAAGSATDAGAPDAAARSELAALAEPVGLDGWTAEQVWVDDAEMARLNGLYRGKPEPTDVLSFGNLVAGGDGPPAVRAGEGHAACDLWWDGVGGGETGEPGDAGAIVIAPGFVRRRCERHGWDVAAEFALLTVHGALHLLGWDHESPPEAAAMRARETELLARRGWPHPLAGKETDDGGR
ncbi:MAG: rRNA maturation RNase YbeY [bacterium]|nr:rRNA maturation RNase YbeY [bacterium]